MHGKKRNANRVFVGKPDGKRLLGRLVCGSVVIFNLFLDKYDGVAWTGLLWLRIGTIGRLL
jgi:hypothetical protein